MAGIQYEIRQQQPFCWQPKSARRFIRQQFPRASARDMLLVYDALTELASDQNGNPRGRWDRKLISKMACVSRTTVIKSMKALVLAGLVAEIANRDGKGHVSTPTILLLTHEEMFHKQAIPESKNDTQGKSDSVDPELDFEGKKAIPESKSQSQGFGQQLQKNPVVQNKVAKSNKGSGPQPRFRAGDERPGQRLSKSDDRMPLQLKEALKRLLDNMPSEKEGAA